MSLSDVEQLLKVIEGSLKSAPRNAYEAEQRLQKCRADLDEAQSMLKDFSGPRALEVRALWNEVQKKTEVAAQVQQAVSRKTQTNSAFFFDIATDEAEEINQEEIESAAHKVGIPKRPPNKKLKGKDKRRKKDSSAEGEQLEVGFSAEASPCASPSPPGLGSSAAKEAVESPAPTQFTVFSRDDGVLSTDIAASVVGSGRCEALADTPLARIYFSQEYNFDGSPCICAVELYRCVLLAIAYGEPKLSAAERAAVVAQVAPHCRTTAPMSVMSAVDTKDTCSMPRGSPKGEAEAEEEAEEEQDTEGDFKVDLTLAEQLVAAYDKKVQAEEEEDNMDNSAIPREVSDKLRRAVRHFSLDIWVVLLCHGGYFAGGVFVEGECIQHKAFQRYVVRKKQGGKQSSSAKDTGSYNSAGSQIRAAQELKWRIDVRDILVDWAPLIDAAAVVLYVAPGPQNRGVLMDFSLLPAAAARNGKKGTSPVSAADPRVCRAPLTTHRPTFEEVRRVFEVCSRCNILYGAEREKRTSAIQ